MYSRIHTLQFTLTLIFSSTHRFSYRYNKCTFNYYYYSLVEISVYEAVTRGYLWHEKDQKLQFTTKLNHITDATKIVMAVMKCLYIPEVGKKIIKKGLYEINETL